MRRPGRPFLPGPAIAPTLTRECDRSRPALHQKALPRTSSRRACGRRRSCRTGSSSHSASRPDCRRRRDQAPTARLVRRPSARTGSAGRAGKHEIGVGAVRDEPVPDEERLTRGMVPDAGRRDALAERDWRPGGRDGGRAGQADCACSETSAAAITPLVWPCMVFLLVGGAPRTIGEVPLTAPSRGCRPTHPGLLRGRKRCYRRTGWSSPYGPLEVHQ